MKRFVTAAVFCGLLVSPLANLSASPAGAWFDMENCTMCKGMASEKGLMENMQWENHAINTGSMSVTVVAEGFEESFDRAQDKMEKSGKLLMKGQKMDLCGFCKSMGSLMMSGAKMEKIDTKAGHVMLITSDDAEVVKMIHAHVERTNEEFAKMMESHDSHEGHDHN